MRQSTAMQVLLTATMRLADARLRGMTFVTQFGAAPRRSSSPHRRRVLDAALGPQPVDAATDAEFGARSHVAVEHFSIIADLFDDAHRPMLRQPELLAGMSLHAQQAPDLWLVGLQRVVDIPGGYAELLGIEHRIERPLHDIEPLVVAMAPQGSERFLGNDLRQDHVVVGIG